MKLVIPIKKKTVKWFSSRLEIYILKKYPTHTFPPPRGQLCYGNDNKPPGCVLEGGIRPRRKRVPHPHPPTSARLRALRSGRWRPVASATRWGGLSEAMFHMPELFPRRKGLDASGPFGPDVSAVWVALTRRRVEGRRCCPCPSRGAWDDSVAGPECPRCPLPSAPRRRRMCPWVSGLRHRDIFAYKNKTMQVYSANGQNWFWPPTQIFRYLRKFHLTTSNWLENK